MCCQSVKYYHDCLVPLLNCSDINLSCMPVLNSNDFLIINSVVVMFIFLLEVCASAFGLMLILDCILVFLTLQN